MSVPGAVGGDAVTATGSVTTGIPTHRQCEITITDGCSCYSLSNPRWFIESGSCASPFPPNIHSNESGSALFIKTPDTACGAVGVATYDLLRDGSHQASKEIAIMFSNPYDFDLYSNWFAVGIFDSSTQCDYNLYDEMYNGSSQYFVRGKASDGMLNYKGTDVSIQATMSDAYEPVMKVELIETN